MNKLLCLFGHKWSSWRNAPGQCALMRVCTRCMVGDKQLGHHNYSRWSETFQVVMARFNGRGETVSRYIDETQRRVCDACGIEDRRVIK